MLTSGRRRGGTPGTGLGPRSVRLTLGRLKAAFEMRPAVVTGCRSLSLDGSALRRGRHVPCALALVPRLHENLDSSSGFDAEQNSLAERSSRYRRGDEIAAHVEAQAVVRIRSVGLG